MMSNGAGEAGATVWIQYDRPTGVQMMRHTGRLDLYDDGHEPNHLTVTVNIADN